MRCEIGDCIAQTVGRETEARIDVVVRSGLRHSIGANCERGPENGNKEQRQCGDHETARRGPLRQQASATN